MISKISLLAEKLKSLRAEAGMSQDEMATVMGISRMTYIASELGNRIPKRHEIENIARSFEIPLSSLLGEPEVKKTTPKSIENDPNYRFKQVLLYILSQCGQRPNIGKTIVNKLLYFADFNFYEKNGEQSITSAQYVKLPFGPVPSVMDGAISEMVYDGQLHTFEASYGGYTQQRLVPLVDADLSLFSALEIQEMNRVIEKFGDKSANWISLYSHEDVPYKATEKIGDPISYGLAFYRTPEYSVRPAESYED